MGDARDMHSLASLLIKSYSECAVVFRRFAATTHGQWALMWRNKYALFHLLGLAEETSLSGVLSQEDHWWTRAFPFCACLNASSSAETCTIFFFGSSSFMA